ncbi:MAG TPA: hypothetical protein VMP08_15125, partial [Anaerolineae bacterium]|nr:hypothetical protein [Anaerolineae bacterium]
MSFFFRRPGSSPDGQPSDNRPGDEHAPIVLSRRQLRLLIAIFVANIIVVIVLAILAFSTPAVQIVERMVPQVVSLSTRTLVPTVTPT